MVCLLFSLGKIFVELNQNEKANLFSKIANNRNDYFEDKIKIGEIKIMNIILTNIKISKFI
jgi:hypothetical protein